MAMCNLVEIPKRSGKLIIQKLDCQIIVVVCLVVNVVVTVVKGVKGVKVGKCCGG